jgi:hypothetical protein
VGDKTVVVVNKKIHTARDGIFGVVTDTGTWGTKTRAKLLDSRNSGGGAELGRCPRLPVGTGCLRKYYLVIQAAGRLVPTQLSAALLEIHPQVFCLRCESTSNLPTRQPGHQTCQ